MADDRFDSRPTPLRDSLPWTDLFRTFRVALDPKKLLLAAAGILAMALGWWVISLVFYNVYPIPVKEKGYGAPSPADIERKHPEFTTPEARARFQAEEQD